jgi:hypothetical protein
MFLSFLVPKISTTISSTTSQCQMLKNPCLLLNDERRILGQPLSQGRGPPIDVHVQVVDLLPPSARC